MALFDEIMADGPTAYWRLGEPFGAMTAVDATGHGFDGAYDGGLTLGVPSLDPSSVDTAATFDGVDDHVDMGDPAPWFRGDFTVECLFATTQTSQGFMFTKYVDTVPGDNGVQVFTQDGQIHFAGRDGTNFYHHFASGLGYADGEMHHLVGLRRGSVWEIWLDGCEKSAADQLSSGDMSCAEHWYIGTVLENDVFLSHYFRGTLDEVVVYDGHALSLERIRAHATAAGLPPCGAWSFGRVAF